MRSPAAKAVLAERAPPSTSTNAPSRSAVASANVLTTTKKPKTSAEET
ncbi:MAG: hypothetical protein ABI948_06390 [Thermoleophilia bacterium]